MNTGDFHNSVLNYMSKMRRTVTGIVKNHNALDDIMQECCLRIIEKEKLYDSSCNRLNSWMNTVTRHAAINFVKNKNNQQHESLVMKDLLNQPEDNRYPAEHVNWMHSQLETLSEKEKTIVDMKYYQNKKMCDISKKLDISERTVSRYLLSINATLKRRAQKTDLFSI